MCAGVRVSDDLPIAVIALVLGLLPLAARMVRSGGGKTAAGTVALIVLGMIAFLLGASALNARQEQRRPPKGLPRIIDHDGYVGADACRSCHPYEHATWEASYHRTMTQVASPESILAPFDGTELHLEGVTWHLERRGEQFWVKGEEEATTAEWRVAMTTGSHNYQLYWLEPEPNQAGLVQFPLVYFLEEGIWIPRKERFLQPPRERTPIETGRWKSHCIKCHATAGRKEPQPSGETRAADLGIACEACHGPGSEHVAANHSPWRRYRLHFRDEPDPTIVNPRRLSHDRATEVCGQCHGIEIFLDDKKAEDWAHEGSGFRPGKVLSDYQTTVIGRYDDNPPEVQRYLDHHETFRLENCFWSDGTLRVTGREYHGMLESPCYQRGEMSCLSCHKLHRSRDDARSFEAWRPDQLGEGMNGDQACIQCHERYDTTEAVVAHTHHEAGSTGSACYNCHMPYTTWGLLGAVRSHTVESPSVQTSLATGRPNACNQCHLDQTLEWTAQKLEEWYKMAPPELTQDEKNIVASALWTLRGDAGQRALMAWSMGWRPARDISGTGWLVPYLSTLMMDPYHAVRYNAQRALRRYPEYESITADGVAGATKEEHLHMASEVFVHWQKTYPGPEARTDPKLLMRQDAMIDQAEFKRLATERDNRLLVLFE